MAEYHYWQTLTNRATIFTTGTSSRLYILSSATLESFLIFIFSQSYLAHTQLSTDASSTLGISPLSFSRLLNQPLKEFPFPVQNKSLDAHLPLSHITTILDLITLFIDSMLQKINDDSLFHTLSRNPQVGPSLSAPNSPPLMMTRYLREHRNRYFVTCDLGRCI